MFKEKTSKKRNHVVDNSKKILLLMLDIKK